jgi:hypothetical protein
MKRLPPIGTLARFHWDDICAHTNALASEAKVARCVTIGLLHASKCDHIVVATSLFEGDQKGPDACGDFVAIPRGVLRKIEPIKS